MTKKPPLPPHDTRFGYICIDLVGIKYQKTWDDALDTLKDELEPLVINSGYLVDAPFSWVSFAIRYGLKYDSAPTYEPISKKYGALPLGFEVDVRNLIDAPYEDVYAILKRVSLIALMHAGEKYNRPVEIFQQMLAELEQGKNISH